MGAFLRDELGSFVVAFSCHDSDMYTTTKAEAWGLYKCLEWIALTLLSSYPDFVAVFARRQANGNAHALARATLSHASRITFD
ncbi:hypothetical protein L195_g046352, partial [Trifolium pratense]